MDFEPKIAWLACGALAIKDKTGPCDKLPDGLYRRTVGPWRIVLNGTKNESPQQDDHPKLPPFGAYIQYNGWPAGIITPRDGIMAAGEGANEDTFIAAVEAELGCSVEDMVGGH